MRQFLLVVFSAFTLGFGLAGCSVVEAEKSANQQISQEPIVIMIGIDGLAWDAIDRHQAPTLQAMANAGVRAQSMIPTMPTKTFVNFYSLATGLYADGTGITDNITYSKKYGEIMGRDMHGQTRWWGGEPIWVTAEKQGMRTAAMFWLGSEAKIKGRRPSHWTAYDHYKPHKERVNQVLDWLAMPEKDRPRFLTLYFSDVDSAGHRYGPNAPEVGNAILKVDKSIAMLRTGIEELGLTDRVNLIVVSDHGMINIDPEFVVYLDDYIDLEDVFIPQFHSSAGPYSDPFVHIYVKDAANIDQIYAKLENVHKGIKVYKRAEIPQNWHLNNSDRTGDVFVVVDAGGMIFARSLKSKYKYASKATHGYDRFHKDMGASFIAVGPNFKNGVSAAPFDNVEVYGIIAKILGLEPAKTDGDIKNVAYFMEP